MKVQNHINESDKPNWGSGWYRCLRVKFAGETAVWELSQTGHYGFLEAYEKSPHRQLIQATDDESLRRFVKAWGPLRPVLDNWSGTDSIEKYRNERDRLTAIVRLLASVKEPEMQRAALMGLAKLKSKDAIRHLLVGLRVEFPVPGIASGRNDDFEPWLKAATQKQIEAATAMFVLSFFLSVPNHGFAIEQSRRGNKLRATLKFYSLADSLNWMVWQDVSRDHPIQFCEECEKLIPSTDRHARKFCSPECAHRKTAREWQQRKRDRDKEKKFDGTQKTW